MSEDPKTLEGGTALNDDGNTSEEVAEFMRAYPWIGLHIHQNERTPYHGWLGYAAFKTEAEARDCGCHEVIPTNPDLASMVLAGWKAEDVWPTANPVVVSFQKEELEHIGPCSKMGPRRVGPSPPFESVGAVWRPHAEWRRREAQRKREELAARDRARIEFEQAEKVEVRKELYEELRKVLDIVRFTADFDGPDIVLRTAIQELTGQKEALAKVAATVEQWCGRDE